MSNFSLLIVEDSTFVNNTLRDHFLTKGHQCQQAFTLEETLHTLTLFTFDYIILDLHLPDAEEEELVQAIQKVTDTKIFILTSESDRQVRELIFRYGIVDYFLKDDSFQINIDAIDAIMRSIPSNVEHTILTVDDSKLAQRHIATTLGPRNYTLISAYTAQEAQEQLAKHKVSLIILDMELPDLHGSKLLKLFKVNKKFQHIPVIVLSGTISPEIISSVIKAGANDYIEKPFYHESFLLKVCRLIDQYKKDAKIKELNEALHLRVQKEMQKNQAQQVMMLHQSKLAQMGEMISMIAHQWRQPLAAITAVTSNLALLNVKKELDEEKLDEELHKIDHYAQHLSSTITDFRNFFKSNLKAQETTFGSIFESVLKIVKDSIEAKNIKLHYEVTSEISVKTYPNELKQVILNL
ncbi:MAG: response regulator, partial [Thiovulaceae bacterium]|nr:response regulator [Sulfurimonadaceae bacterium]